MIKVKNILLLRGVINGKVGKAAALGAIHHSKTTWTRWEEGQKMSVFVNSQGIKTVHAEGGGAKNGSIPST